MCYSFHIFFIDLIKAYFHLVKTNVVGNFFLVRRKLFSLTINCPVASGRGMTPKETDYYDAAESFRTSGRMRQLVSDESAQCSKSTLTDRELNPLVGLKAQ